MTYLMKMGKLWFVVLFVLFAGVMGYSNPEVITIHFPYIRSLNFPIYQVILISFISGVLLATLFLIYDNFHKSLVIRRQKAELAELRVQSSLEKNVEKRDDPKLDSSISPSLEASTEK